jgi:predicted DNA-binding WGR domain protein
VLAETSIGLEARNPLANRMRRWNVEIGQDLLGMWLVDVEFGRIGSKGRRMRHAFFDEPAAQAYVGRALRRRATAPVRIGVAYRCVHSSLAAQGLVSRAGIEMAPVETLIA